MFVRIRLCLSTRGSGGGIVTEDESELIGLTETERAEVYSALGREWLSPRVRERLEMVKLPTSGTI
jgi:hypothetical protein